MKYDFETIIDRKNDPFSFSMKWQGAAYVLKMVGIENIRDDAICLETADMDFHVAPEIIEDLHKLVDHGIFGYSNVNAAYKQAVKGWYSRRQGWDFAEDDITYMPGTHTAVAELVKQFTKPDEGVIVLTPCYGYHGDVEENGRRYVSVEMINDGKEYYTVDYAALEKACADPKNTMIIICHPHNPTGRVYTHDEMTKIAEICRKNDVVMVSDEVHSDILRKGVVFEPFMKAVGTKNVIACTAVNKTFNLAGLAMTNVIICDPDLKAKFKYHALPTPFGIQAVISAYTKGDAWVDAMNAYIDENIDVCLAYIKENLPKAVVCKPEGGYSLNIDFSAYGYSEDEVAKKIYGDAGVIMNSGRFFDDKRGLQIHRACLSSPKAMCLEAFERIAKEFNK